MHSPAGGYTTLDKNYCSTPAEAKAADVVVIGSGLGLMATKYLSDRLSSAGRDTQIVVLERGPFDVLDHVANTAFARRHFIADDGRMGGKLSVWGVSTPRPPESSLKSWPFEFGDLTARFAAVERLMGVSEKIPMSGRRLEQVLLERLRDYTVEQAPLAINGRGQRYCPLCHVPPLLKRGVQFVSHFRCEKLTKTGSQVTGIQGTWLDGQTYEFQPRHVVLAVGVEPSLPLLKQVSTKRIRLQAADHHRVDMHGMLPKNSIVMATPEEQGVAVLVVHCTSSHGIPYHLEVKVAPWQLWRENFMQSSDNLRGDHAPDEMYIQIQAVGAMHDRYPSADLLNVESQFAPVMSARDELLEREIRSVMRDVCSAIGLQEPCYCPRQLGTNHHTYGAFRVDDAVTRSFRFQDYENLFVLPPTAFVDVDDDANPTLKSAVLSQYAMDAIAEDLMDDDVVADAQSRVFAE